VNPLASSCQIERHAVAEPTGVRLPSPAGNPGIDPARGHPYEAFAGVAIAAEIYGADVK
jgi:hypothetical protein